jgi:hypothetical protein
MTSANLSGESASSSSRRWLVIVSRSGRRYRSQDPATASSSIEDVPRAEQPHEGWRARGRKAVFRSLLHGG